MAYIFTYHEIFVVLDVIRIYFVLHIEMEISRIGQRIMDELIRPLRLVQLDDTEYACVKAIVFFDPSKNLNNFGKCLSIQFDSVTIAP